VARGSLRAAAEYDSELGFMDDLFRTLFEELGLDRNTLLIVTADHGEEFGDHGQSGHNGGLHEELVHVPLFVLGRDGAGKPDFETGRVSRLVSTLDLLPTLRDLLGQPVAYSEGKSLVEELDGARVEVDGAPRAVFSHRAAERSLMIHEFFSVNQAPWQLIINPETGGRKLYNLERDPHSLKNMAFSRPRVIERLGAELDEFRKREKRFGREFAEPLILDQEAQDELGRLGYAE
jgi:arylsulfatase A-like enzyme